MDFSKLLQGFVIIEIWISVICYMDLPKMLYGFVKVVTWICQNWYMNFSKLLHGFAKVVSWIFKVVTWLCKSCSQYFLVFAEQIQCEVWSRFQSLLKLLPWTKGVEWVKVLNTLGLLCLLQCFFVWLTLKLSGFILRKKKRLKTVQFGASTIFNLFQSLKTHFNL